MSHSIKLKVYYEDTDAGGVVYYARYLGFMERARTEFLADHGIDVAEYHGKGLFFVIAHVDISYRRSARLGDILAVTTEVVEKKKVSLVIRNRVLRGEELLVDALITLAAIDRDGRPRRLPEAFETLHPNC